MKTKWSYLAGLFDGEGCAHIAKVNAYGNQLGYRLDIHITTTCLESAKWLVSNFGGVYYASDWTTKHNPKWKPAYRWVPKGKKNKEELLLGILPYLIIKREIVKVCLDFLRLAGICPGEREKLYEAAGRLTRRGLSVETNTQGSKEKRESDLVGNYESAPEVIQVA